MIKGERRMPWAGILKPWINVLVVGPSFGSERKIWLSNIKSCLILQAASHRIGMMKHYHRGTPLYVAQNHWSNAASQISINTDFLHPFQAIFMYALSLIGRQTWATFSLSLWVPSSSVCLRIHQALPTFSSLWDDTLWYLITLMLPSPDSIPPAPVPSLSLPSNSWTFPSTLLSVLHTLRLLLLTLCLLFLHLLHLLVR